MKRPKKYKAGQLMWAKDTTVYRCKDIEPLLDRLHNLRTWIIENAEDVTGQDGVKWNAIDRDEILNYLKAQDDDI